MKTQRPVEAMVFKHKREKGSKRTHKLDVNN